MRHVELAVLRKVKLLACSARWRRYSERNQIMFTLFVELLYTVRIFWNPRLCTEVAPSDRGGFDEQVLLSDYKWGPQLVGHLCRPTTFERASSITIFVPLRIAHLYRAESSDLDSKKSSARMLFLVMNHRFPSTCNPSQLTHTVAAACSAPRCYKPRTMGWGLGQLVDA